MLLYEQQEANNELSLDAAASFVAGPHVRLSPHLLIFRFDHSKYDFVCPTWCRSRKDTNRCPISPTCFRELRCFTQSCNGRVCSCERWWANNALPIIRMSLTRDISNQEPRLLLMEAVLGLQHKLKVCSTEDFRLKRLEFMI